MKLVLLFLFCSVFSIVGSSQDSSITLSKFETFSSQAGTILKTETKAVGLVGLWTVKKVKTTDMASGKNAVAINIDYEHDNLATVVNANTLYIDIDDLDSVIQSVTYFINATTTLKPTGYVHIAYITTSDIEVCCDYLTDAGKWQFRIGKVYQKLRSSVPGTYVVFNKKRVVELVALLNQAKVLEF